MPEARDIAFLSREIISQLSTDLKIMGSSHIESCIMNKEMTLILEKHGFKEVSKIYAMEVK